MDRLTTGHGAPIGDKLNSVSVGPRGPLLLQVKKLKMIIMTNDNECCRIMFSSRSSPTLTGRGSQRELCMPREPGHSDTSR